MKQTTIIKQEETMKIKKIKRLKKAQEYLNRAWNEFNTLANELEWKEGRWYAKQYRNEINDLLNPDNGEDGLEVWIKNLQEEQ